MDAPANSSGNTDHGFMKKLKEFDGLAMSISNNNKVGSGEHSSEHRSSHRFVKLAEICFDSKILVCQFLLLLYRLSIRFYLTFFFFNITSSQNDDSSNGSDGNTTGVRIP